MKKRHQYLQIADTKCGGSEQRSSQPTENLSQDAIATVRCKFDTISNLIQDLEGRVTVCEPRSRHARWLWRSGNLARGGWVPWEFEALNSSPQLFVWHPEHASRITTTHAGLHRISVGIFTYNCAMIQLCIQDEAVFTLEPPLQDAPAWEAVHNKITSISKRREHFCINSLFLAKWTSRTLLFMCS